MDEDRRFEEIKPRSMRHDVVHQLRQAILGGRLRPGERLNESEIAREMGISRGPVREAIVALEQEGLVESEHWRGSFVVELNPDTFLELMDVRVLLETHAARLATQRCTPALCSQLDAAIRAMRDACANGDMEETVDCDMQFHRLICQMSGNRLLLKMWEQLVGRLRLALFLCVENGYELSNVIETHPPVVEALRRGDAELVAQLLNARTKESAELIAAHLKRRMQ